MCSTPPAKLVLASGSPRRRALLKLITTDFEVVPAAIEERSSSTQPERIVVEIARQKAEAVEHSGCRGIILAADTAVFLDHTMLGKPRDRDEAYRMLTRLSGRVHTVLTGLCVVHTHTRETLSECVSARVFFKTLGHDVIERYLRTEVFLDKAGAYAVQQRGGPFVDHVEGDIHNVMGLPVARVARLLKRLGYC